MPVTPADKKHNIKVFNNFVKKYATKALKENSNAKWWLNSFYD